MDDFSEFEAFDGFDARAIEKGWTYHNRGAVLELAVSNQTITALVKDRGPSPYLATIPLSSDGKPDPVEGECTCPEVLLCRHMAAALIEYYQRPPRSAHTRADRGTPPPARAPARPAADQPEPRDPLQELTRLMAEGRSREHLIPLRPVPGDAEPGWAARYLHRAPDAVDRSGERRRLVFAVGHPMVAGLGYTAGLKTGTQRPVLLPAAQRLKKNGEPGRTERYQAASITETPDAASSELLGRIRITGLGTLLLPHWDYLTSHPEIPLFPSDENGRPASSRPYRVRKTRLLIIRLVPTLRTSGKGGEIGLCPAMSFVLEGKDDGGEQERPLWVEAWEGRMVVSLGYRTLAWLDAEPRYVELARAMIEDQPVLTIADGHQLRRSMDADRPAGFRLDALYENVRLITAVPTTRLTIVQGSLPGQITVSIAFDYGVEVRAREGDYVLKLRNPDIELSTVRTLREVFGRVTQTFDVEPFPAGRGGTRLGVRLDIRGFLQAFGDELLSRGIDLCLEDPRDKIVRTGGPVRIVVETGIDWFGLRATSGEPIDLRALDPNDPLLASGLVRNGGKLLYVGRQEAEKLRQIVALLDPDARDARVARRDLDALARLSEIVDTRPPDLERLVSLARTLQATERLPALPLPTGLTATLRGYQVVGYRWLAYLAENDYSGCLADDMGLGKTVQALAVLLRHKEAGVREPSLVVAPVSTLQNWRLEAGRFAPFLRLTVHHGASRLKDAAALTRADLVVVSYATMRVDAELLQSISFHTVILDEAQTIKNPQSQSFSVVKGLKSRHRITLTGTPLENSVIDLWSQLDFLEPGLLGSLSGFRREYGSKKAGPRVERLRRIIRPFILRRTKDVVESSLPPKAENTLYAEMGARQAAAYQAIRRHYRQLIAEKLRQHRVSECGALIFEGLLRMRQAACFAAQADPRYKGVPSCKLEVLGDLLDEVLAEGHRVLVFSQFVESLKEIRTSIEARKTSYAYLDGSTRNRQRIIDDFQRKDGPPVFLLSLKAGGVGINLTAADYVVIFDPWWNPAVESQAVDRTHRIGQAKPVFVYRIVTRESIEEQILELQGRKRALAQELIDQNPRSLLTLTEDEVLELFGDLTPSGAPA